jgi:hypothetical protein
MTIKLLSDTYLLDGGEAGLFRDDWADQPEGTVSALSGPCRRNRIEDVPLLEPARYQVWLAGCRVTDRATQVSGIVSTIAPLSLTIGDEELKAGEAALTLPDAGLFQITLRRAGEPAALQKIRIANDPVMTEIQADATGTITLLEDPRGLFFALPDDITASLRKVV